ncbi:MAG TPA: inositol monophosphatase family protein, partial [Alphaproteobacteria bacterium]|nr:inositol monophosphatase family protein [Alphaproteobacteria bacterium]
EHKPDHSIVTIADIKVEDFLISTLSKRLKPHLQDVSFLAEEKRDAPKVENPKHVVIIDPIDGTTNFSSGNPTYAITAALADNVDGRLVVRESVTLQPETSMFTLSSEAGAFQFDMNSKTMRELDLRHGDANKIVSLWGDIADKQDGPVIADMLRRLGEKGYAVRMIGSCVLTNAGVASGEYAGAIIYSGNKVYAHPWDLASSHQITRAHGIVTTIDGTPDPLNNDPHSMIAARNEIVHRDLLDIVQAARASAETAPKAQPVTLG